MIETSKRFAYADLIACALPAAHALENSEPRIFKEVVSGKDADKWIKAMKDKMESLYKNDTWELVEKLENKKVVGCKWVYKVKQGILGVESKRFKARLVSKGYTQRDGIGFIEIYSPVVSYASIRMILSIVAVNNMHLEHMDVKTAFLHGELQEQIIMSQLEGFVYQSRGY